MLCYCPTDKHRVCWYGGSSTMLHYEEHIGGLWTDLEVRTLEDFPTGVKELHQKLVEFYNFCS